jgi:hypothetical protein
VPAAAHLRHYRPAEGRDAHPRQHHLERYQPPDLCRLPQRRRDDRHRPVLPGGGHRGERASGPVHGRDGGGARRRPSGRRRQADRAASRHRGLR